MDPLAITIISVVTTALFALLFMQMQNMREDMRAGFGRLEAQNAQLREEARANREEARAENAQLREEARAYREEASAENAQLRKEMRVGLGNNMEAIKDLEIKMTNKFAEHGERLVRIEFKLGIDPPAEAA